MKNNIQELEAKIAELQAQVDFLKKYPVPNDVSQSQIPSWHPAHIHGAFCDGQDGRNSLCNQEKIRGPQPGEWEKFVEAVRMGHIK